MRSVSEMPKGELENTSHYHAALYDSVPIGLVAIDDNGQIHGINLAGAAVFGAERSNLIGRSFGDYVAQNDINRFLDHLRQCQEAAQQVVTDLTLNPEYGDSIHVRLQSAIVSLTVSQTRLFQTAVTDIIEHKQAQREVRELTELLDQVPDAVLVRDLEDRVLIWNKSAERLYGWTAEEALGQNIRRLHYRADPLQLEDAKSAVFCKGEWQGEMRLVTKDDRDLIADCRWRPLRDEAGRPKSILVVNTDITEKKKLEAQLLRTQRLEIIGELASGIAHDLNNLLSPILIAGSMLEQKDADEQTRRWLEVICRNALVGSDLVKHVLTFAKGGRGERVAFSPRHLMKDLIKVLEGTFPKSVEIKYSIPNSLGMVLGDATQINQVLMNLCVNGRDAMPSGGRLTLEAENVRVDEIYAAMRMAASPGQFVLIKVTDTGKGIPAEIREKIFDPFFTTKEPGKGTGLGLATVLRIVESHGGFVEVESEVGRGTTFKAYLPALEAEQSIAAAIAVEAETELPVGHGELILVVDDEASLLEITKEALEAHGYTVLMAGDGTEAVARVAEHSGKIRAVLTDLMMPYMSGQATIRALRKMYPQTKIIAISGTVEDNELLGFAKEDAEVFLSKPFTAEQLLRTLAGVLGI